jgi:hypothetical protein
MGELRIVAAMAWFAPMISGAALSRRFLTGAILLALTWTAAGQAQPVRVCAFGFNSPEELVALRSSLPPTEFDFVDFSADLLVAQNARSARLTAAVAAGQTVEDAPAPWLLHLCRPDLQCDISIYSGEFAGRFFGRYGSSLSIQEMEEASCQGRCQGLFHRSQEVFLLACNTLATKDRDSRTPQEYLQVLLDHGFDRAEAENVVELRYGPLGPSFRESFRRIFMGVPRIYGFSSVAPRGEWTAARLREYFRSQHDYGRYLARASGDTKPNKKLLAAFRDTSLVQMSGMTSSEPRAAERDLVCSVYDDTRPVAQRLRTIQQLLTRSDFLSFLPTIEVFVNRHPPQQWVGEEREIFAEIQRQEPAREEVIRIVHGLEASALKMELARLARQLGWMTSDQFRRLAVDGARQLLLQPLSSDVVDIMCEITKLQFIGGEFASEDLPETLFHEAQGLRLVACLSPIDERVSARLVAGLDSNDVWARRWAAYALSSRLPLEDAILKRVASHLDDASTDVRDRLQQLFKAQRPLSAGVLEAVRECDPRFAEDLQLQARPR